MSVCVYKLLMDAIGERCDNKKCNKIIEKPCLALGKSYCSLKCALKG